MTLHARFHTHFLRSLNREFGIDPLTLGAIGTAIGTLAGGGAALASAFGPKPKAPTAPPPSPPVQSPIGTQTSNIPANNPSFLAAAAAPQNDQAARKSLLGQ